MKTKINSFSQLSWLKVLSIIIFLIITRNNPHIVMPMFLVLITSFLYIFSEFKNIIIPLLASIGLVMVLLSFIRKRKIILIIGYFLTYIILFDIMINENLWERANKEIYFLVTTICYITLSIYIILRSIKSLKN